MDKEKGAVTDAPSAACRKAGESSMGGAWVAIPGPREVILGVVALGNARPRSFCGCEVAVGKSMGLAVTSRRVGLGFGYCQLDRHEVTSVNGDGGGGVMDGVGKAGEATRGPAVL